MRQINEILKDIQNGKWLRDKNFGLSLAKEFSEAYEHWMQTEHPTEYASASIRTAVRPFYRRVAIWLMTPPSQQEA